MLNKALLGTPKEFKVTIGSQTLCIASTAKTAYMPGDLVTINISYNTGYHNATVATSTGTPVSKVNNNTYTFVMPSKDVVITASASVMSFTITVNKNAGGNVSVKSVANYGETVTVTLSPLEGYKINNITVTGASISGSGTNYNFIMPASNVTVTVNFSVAYHIILTVGHISAESMLNVHYYGYDTSQGIGKISKIPYWDSTSSFLSKLYCKGRRLEVSGSYIYFADNAYGRSVKVNGFLLSNSSNQEYREFWGKTDQQIPIIFDPPPTGYL